MINNKLSRESKKIITFINNVQLDLNHRLTKKTLHDLKTFYYKLMIHYRKFKLANKLANKTVEKRSNNDMMQLIGSNFYAKGLLKQDKDFNFQLFNLSYTNTYTNNKVAIKLYCKSLPKKMEKLMNIIANIVLTLNYLIANKELITLNIYLLESKRELPTTFKVLGPDEINGGSTYRDSGDVDCWRQQELVKVLIHEMIHTLNNDISNITDTQLNKFFNNVCLDNTIILPNERYGS